MKALIAYHAKCVDGLVAATNTLHALPSTTEIHTLAVNYGVDASLGLPECSTCTIAEMDQLFFVDYCPDMAVLRTLLENENLHVIILDHHDTALKRLKNFPIHMYPNLTVIIVENLSGAGLTAALKHSIPLMSQAIPLDDNYLTAEMKVHGVRVFTNSRFAIGINPHNHSYLSKITQSRDLWLDNEYRDAGDYFTTYMGHNNFSATIAPSAFLEFIEGEGGIEAMVQKGKVLFEELNAKTRELLKEAETRQTQIGKDTVKVIVGYCLPGYSSMFGQFGYQDSPNTIVIALTFVEAEQCVELSLRAGEGVVVNDLADGIWGGGGHPKASGARYNAEKVDIDQIFKQVFGFIEQHPEKVFE